MPLPWKKTKPNRISRIVADLQTPSRVVETGFPTSVVDLFVKNRDRIKRHTLKKTKHKHSPLHVSESAAPPPTPSLSPNNSPRLPAHEAVALVAARVDDLQQDSTPARLEFDVDKSATANANANSNSKNSNSTVFVVAAKMFLAVVPVLSIKKLALGITLSALLLFLLEILGQFAARLFNSSSTRNRYFSTTAAERRRDRLIDREEEEGFPRINSASNNEIQMVESNSDYEQSGSGGAGEKGLGGCWDLEMEMEEEGKLEMGKSERSRSSKLKAKIIKKLIPKKLRSGKRTKRNKNGKNKMKEEAGITIMENEQGTESSSEEEDQEEQEVWEVQQMWEPEEEEIGPSAMGKEKEEEEEEEEEERKKKNLECRFVILMILLGLCEGRFQALVLTVSGSFMFKFIKFLYQKWKFG